MEKSNFKNQKIVVILLMAFLLLPVISLAVCCPMSVPCDELGLSECDPPEPGSCENELELCYPEFAGFQIFLGIDINQLIAWFYYFLVAISGLATFFMLVWGGFKYLTSAGNPAAMAAGRERMVHAIVGLLIIITSYLFLRAINPELTILKLPSLPSS